MSNKKLALIVVCLSLAMGLTDCTVAHYHQPGESVTVVQPDDSKITATQDADRAITKRVQKALASSKYAAVRNITVETYQGTVHLTGIVNNHAQANEAVRIARAVPGVKAVVFNLTVKK